MNRLLVVVISFVFASGAHSQSLLQAMQTAVDTNPEIQAAKLERRSRQHEIYQAEAAYYPQVSVLLGVGDEDTSSPSTNNDTVSLTRNEKSINARWGLFEGFGRQGEVERQQAREQSAKYNADWVVDSVALDAAKAYIDILRYQALLDLANTSLENHIKIHKQMQSRFDSGVGSRADLAQVTGRLALANTNVITVNSNLINARRDYEKTIGYYPDVETLVYPGDLSVQLPATEDEMLKAAAESNPILKSAGADVSAAIAQHKTAKSPFYPRLSLEAEHSKNEDINGVEGDDETTLVALRLRYDLFTGGKDVERKRQTAFLMTEAQELRNDAYRRVMQSAHLNWSAHNAVVQQIPYLELHVESATDTKKAYILQFDVGRRSLLDVLNAENEEIESRRALIDARHDLIFTQLQILSGVGRLVEGVSLTQEPEPDIKRFYAVRSEPLDLKQPSGQKIDATGSDQQDQGAPSQEGTN